MRLPLAAIAFPVLRRQTAATLDAFLATCDEVVHADGQVNLFEYCLSRMLQVQVRDLEHFSRFLLDRLLNATGVSDVNSSFVLRTVKEFRALPLSQLERG